MSRTIRAAALLLAATGAASALGACTYVERDRPPQQATIVVPQQQPQPQPMVVAPQPAPTVTVRPSY